MKIIAKLLKKFDVVEVSASFKKREFVVEFAENPQYPEYVKFETIQDKCELLNEFEVDQEMEIHFNLKGRKWVNPKGETIYFNSLQAWKILNIADQTSKSTQQSDGAASKNPELPPLEAYENDDVPF